MKRKIFTLLILFVIVCGVRISEARLVSTETQRPTIKPSIVDPVQPNVTDQSITHPKQIITDQANSPVSDQAGSGLVTEPETGKCKEGYEYIPADADMNTRCSDVYSIGQKWGSDLIIIGYYTCRYAWDWPRPSACPEGTTISHTDSAYRYSCYSPNPIENPVCMEEGYRVNPFSVRGPISFYPNENYYNSPINVYVYSCEEEDNSGFAGVCLDGRFAFHETAHGGLTSDFCCVYATPAM